MSKYYEIALAIDARDADVIAKDIEGMEDKPVEFLNETPDNLYVIYYWDFAKLEDAAAESLLKKLEGMRHALYTVSEDDEIWKDVEIADSWGVDEQFSELLEVNAKIKMFGDRKTLEEKAAASMDHIMRIMIDLSEWGTGFPTGAVAHTDSGDVLSDYCDDADEFISFIRRYAARITEDTELRFVLASGEIERCMDTVNAIRKEFEMLKPYEREEEVEK